jgi:mycothione reductase
VIVGAGSGNMLPAKEFADWRIAVVESDRFGGTCLNRGCIPSKILVHTADVAQEVRHAGRFGIGAKWLGADWPAIRERVFARIDPVHERAVAYRRGKGNDVFIGEARFVAPKVLKVGDVEIHGERFVLATGSRPSVPPVTGLADVPYVTSDTVMRLPKLPRSMIVLGGGYIAAEMSHIFGSLGTKVTILARGDCLLSQHDADISARFTQLYRERFDLRLRATVERVVATRKGVRVDLITPAGAQSAEGEVLLVATGRVPNSDRLNVEAAGIDVDDHGHIRTDETYATKVPGIWALGDVANHFQLKHMANAEARLVAHNLLHPDELERGPFRLAPSAVFADPQVASVGATEQKLKAEGRPYSAATRKYSDTAYGWALEDTGSFVKVLADPATRMLLGAHIIGPQASTLIQPLIQAMCLGNTADEVASGVIYIHPALTEVVEQALLEL